MNTVALKIENGGWPAAKLLRCFILLRSAFSLRVLGQQYSIGWYKIAGGGGTTSYTDTNAVGSGP